MRRSHVFSNISAAILSSFTVAATAQPICSSATTAERQTRENEIAAQRAITAHGGVIVWGVVDGVEAVWGAPVVKFKGANQFIPVLAHLQKDQTDFAARLKRGQKVYLRCSTVKLIFGVNLGECVASDPCEIPKRREK